MVKEVLGSIFHKRTKPRMNSEATKNEKLLMGHGKEGGK
jgi:hypothetical protein